MTDKLQSLLIKANTQEEAIQFAQNKGFIVSHALATSDLYQWVVRVKFDVNRAIEWLAKPYAAFEDVKGFPIGALIWYSTPERDSRTNEMEPIKCEESCPITFAQILQAEFQPFSDMEIEEFAGVEGNGYIAIIGDYIVTYDTGVNERQIEIYDNRSSGDDNIWWYTISKAEPIR